MNFFNETGKALQEGDILYMSGVYTTMFKDMLLLYEGSMSIIKRIGRWYMKFDLRQNMSIPPP